MSESESKCGNSLLPLYRVTAGIDVHKEKNVACVLKEVEGGGEAVHEIRTFRNLRSDNIKMAEWFKECKVEYCIMESTGIYWKSPFDLLRNRGINVALVNARAVKNAPGRRTDVESSRWLAILARAGLIRPSLIPPKEITELRELARFRQGLVDYLTSQKNLVYKLLISAGFNVSQVVTDLFGTTGHYILRGILDGWSPEKILNEITASLGYRLKASPEKFLEALTGTLTPMVEFELNMVLDNISQTYKKIAIVEDKLEEMLASLGYEPTLKILETIPGVKRIAAMILIVELGGDLKAFKNASSLSSWAGMCPGNNESAGKRKSSRTNKANRYLRRILCEIANAAIKSECYFREKYKNLVIRRGYKRTIIAIGHKILKVIYCMITRDEVYKDNTVDFQAMSAKKNAPRWIKQLQKFDLLPQ